jgi:hypothetical protein
VSLESFAARRRRITGEYVSGIVSAPMIHRAPVKIAMRPSTQRQPSVSPRKPPMIGPAFCEFLMSLKERAIELGLPIVGPRKGAAAKILIARPRCSAGNMSAITPPTKKSQPFHTFPEGSMSRETNQH